MLQKIIEFFLNLFGGGSKKTGNKATKVSPPKSEKPKTPKVVKSTIPPLPKKITFDIPNVTLTLGMYDSNVQPAAIEELLNAYHGNMFGVRDEIKKSKFRNGDLRDWASTKKVEGTPVLTLQKFLKGAGIIPPYIQPNGIFGYETQSAVRLFQEYIRTVEGDSKIGIPDGVVGKTGWKHVKRWAENRLTAKEWTRGQQSAEYKKWLGMLAKAKEFYQSNPHYILDQVNAKVDQLGKVDTLKTADWKTSANEIHLIGIRRKEEEGKGLRKNDDVFILLINGMVFKFWGSTDPNHGAKVRKDEAFLVEGQHKFRFGWHNRSTESKVYQGLNPFGPGVLVFRDWDNDNKLTDADIKGKGIDGKANTTINIHWTGAGKGASGTWSEGCQVFAGQSYINHKGEFIDCKKYAAVGTSDLKKNTSPTQIVKTKGAYNMFADLLLLFRPQGVDYVYYTLGRDETFSHKFVVDVAGNNMLSDTLKVFELPDNLG